MLWRGICAAAVLAIACSPGGLRRTTDRAPGDGGSDPTRDGSAPADEDSGSLEGGDATTPPPSDGGHLPPVGTDPRSRASVYWVGHSLISHRDVYDGSARTLFELVGDFADAQGHAYTFYRHTTPGAPLSWNWNEEGGKRQELTSNGGAYDVMILTEGISLAESMRWHYTPFYARRFQCALQNASPAAEAYVYESWHHLYASDEDQNYPDPHVYDWRARLSEDRARWEAVADQAFSGVAAPSDMAYYSGAGECTPARRMRLIPVGTALAALHDRLRAPVAGDELEGFTIHHFVQNGFRNWPAEWPVSPSAAGSIDWRARWSTLETFHGGPLDDIHPSARGAYFIALVHYATVYRRSPIGLPTANGVGPGLARVMQEVAWQVVSRDPRTGVAP